MNITKDEDLLREQTRLTRIKADMAELKLKTARGELLSRAEVRKQWKANAANVKAKFLALPELAPQLAGLSAGEVKRVLNTKVREMLNELADEYR